MNPESANLEFCFMKEFDYLVTFLLVKYKKIIGLGFVVPSDEPTQE